MVQQLSTCDDAVCDERRHTVCTEAFRMGMLLVGVGLGGFATLLF